MEYLVREWRRLFLCLAIAITIVGIVVATRTSEWWVLAATVATLAVHSYQFAFMRLRLHLNRPEAEQVAVYPDLGPANRLTILRGFLIAVLFGFVFLPELPGPLGWLPFVTYFSAIGLDYIDGFIARKTGRYTPLGRELEHEFDSLGVLAASVFLVVARVLPAWFILVGVARYVFIAGEALQRARGKTMFPLAHSSSGKILAGYQMVFLAAALIPIIPEEMKRIAGSVIAIPFLLGFVRDWLGVTGIVRHTSDVYARLVSGFNRIAFVIAPRVFRFMPVIAAFTSPLTGIPLYIAVGAGALIALGVLGRTISIALLILVASVWDVLGEYGPGSTVVLITLSLIGTGAGSLFAPEASWFRKHGDEPPPTVSS